jgi:hypothetical protein
MAHQRKLRRPLSLAACKREEFIMSTLAASARPSELSLLVGNLPELPRPLTQEVGALIVHVPECWLGRSLSIRRGDRFREATEITLVRVYERATARGRTLTAVFETLPPGTYCVSGPLGVCAIVTVVPGNMAEIDWRARA